MTDGKVSVQGMGTIMSLLESCCARCYAILLFPYLQIFQSTYVTSKLFLL